MSADDVERLPRQLVASRSRCARLGAEQLGMLFDEREVEIAALGAMTGGQAVQMVKARTKDVPSLSCWDPHATSTSSAALSTRTDTLSTAISDDDSCRRISRSSYHMKIVRTRRVTTRRTGSRRSSPTRAGLAGRWTVRDPRSVHQAGAAVRALKDRSRQKGGPSRRPGSSRQNQSSHARRGTAPR